MAITLKNFIRTVFGNKRIVICDCDFDSSYPTGGELLTASNLGFGKIEYLSIEPKEGYVFSYDYDNSKILAFYADYDASEDGTLIELPNATNLSNVTNAKIFAIGTGLS